MNKELERVERVERDETSVCLRGWGNVNKEEILKFNCLIRGSMKGLRGRRWPDLFFILHSTQCTSVNKMRNNSFKLILLFIIQYLSVYLLLQYNCVLISHLISFTLSSSLVLFSQDKNKEKKTFYKVIFCNQCFILLTSFSLFLPFCLLLNELNSAFARLFCYQTFLFLRCEILMKMSKEWFKILDLISF